jgi:hypothetical protein
MKSHKVSWSLFKSSMLSTMRTASAPISTAKNCLILLQIVHSYFIYEIKYLYIYIIPGFCSFKWYINDLFSWMFYGEITGLRWWTPSVVIRSTFSNFDSNPLFDPNIDTYTKLKRNAIFWEQTSFLRLLIRKRAKVTGAIL